MLHHVLVRVRNLEAAIVAPARHVITFPILLASSLECESWLERLHSSFLEYLLATMSLDLCPVHACCHLVPRCMTLTPLLIRKLGIGLYDTRRSSVTRSNKSGTTISGFKQLFGSGTQELGHPCPSTHMAECPEGPNRSSC